MITRPRRCSRAPDPNAVKGQRDQAILAVLYHGLRREEAAQLQVDDIRHLPIHGKGGKLSYVPLHSVAAERIYAYLESSDHHLEQSRAPLFKPLRGLQSLFIEPSADCMFPFFTGIETGMNLVQEPSFERLKVCPALLLHGDVGIGHRGGDGQSITIK